MDALNFLGGRYKQPQQIGQGRVETFRALTSVSDSPVFIHRVATAAEPAEQAELLKLMTTALVRSAEVKRLILDFGEEQGFWYVVTASEPQCSSLRDWLELQANGSRPALGEDELAWAAMGEFARLFSGVAPPKRKPAIAQPIAPPPPPPPPAPPSPPPVAVVQPAIEVPVALSPALDVVTEPPVPTAPVEVLPPVRKGLHPVNDQPSHLPIFAETLVIPRSSRRMRIIAVILVLLVIALAAFFFTYQYQ